jgi:hypothetical protein
MVAFPLAPTEFLRMEENRLWIDTEEYYIDAPERILGILESVVI